MNFAAETLVKQEPIDDDINTSTIEEHACTQCPQTFLRRVSLDLHVQHTHAGIAHAHTCGTLRIFTGALKGTTCSQLTTVVQSDIPPVPVATKQQTAEHPRGSRKRNSKHPTVREDIFSVSPRTRDSDEHNVNSAAFLSNRPSATVAHANVAEISKIIHSFAPPPLKLAQKGVRIKSFAYLYYLNLL
jgi:hypothetical protein